MLVAQETHPTALVLAHPECTQDVLKLADFIGSTSEIIDFATKDTNDTYIICTEMGIFYELGQKNPNKKFYSVGHRQFCPNMKRISVDKVLTALQNLGPEVLLKEDIAKDAKLPLERMLTYAK